MIGANFENFSKTVLFTCLLCIQWGSGFSKTFEEDLTLSLDEKIQLDKFRDLVQSRLPHKYMNEDVYLIRWLRARNFDLREAEQMLMRDLKWREDNKMDTIHQEDWSFFRKHYPYSLKGRAKDGKPLLYFNVGAMEVRKTVLSGQVDSLHRYIEKGLDEACGLVRELGEKYKNVSQGDLILDVKGFNLIDHGCLRCFPVFLRLIVQYENHHPGCADRIIVVNVPAIAHPFIEPSKALLHPDTKKVLSIYGTNRNKWLPEILSIFDLDQLPPELGGSMEYRDEDDNEDWN